MQGYLVVINHKRIVHADSECSAMSSEFEIYVPTK